MENNKKNNVVLPIVGALLAIVALVAFIVIKVTDQQAYYEKWKDYDDCGWM